MPATTKTTIKVSTELRDRISRHAAERGTTAAGLLADLLDRAERDRRFALVADAYAAPDQDYAAELDEWDEVLSDGLE